MTLRARSVPLTLRRRSCGTHGIPTEERQPASSGPNELISVLGGAANAMRAALKDWFKRSSTRGGAAEGSCGHCRARETGAAKACGRAGRFHGEGCGIRAAAGRAGGAGMTQDGPPSPHTGRARGDLRRRSRRWLLGPSPLERSETGPLPTRHSQAEDQAKASWRTRAGAIGGGSAASFRCWRILRITSLCVMAAMIRSAPS